MPETTDDKLRRVTATANRLRLLQIDFADENAAVRRKFLSEEIERALSAIVPGERKAFLDELMSRFPTWDPNVELAPPEEQTAVYSPTDQQELQDPSFLVTRLTDLVPLLSEEDKQALIERLREAGLVEPEAQPDMPEQAMKALTSELQLPENQPIDTTRLLNLVGQLVRFAQSLDQLAWETWKRMAPRSAIGRPARLRTTMRQFVAGDREVTYDQVNQSLESLRRLVASLISAVGQAGRRVAANCIKRLSPSEIALLVKTESGGLWKSLIQKSPDAKCWEKYVELAGQITEDSMEREIVEAIAASAEQLMKTTGA